jgi:ANTAR domain
MPSMFAARDQTARDQTGHQLSHDAGGAEQCRITQLEQQVEGLTRALQNRDTIGQAKGILLSHYAIGPDEAFALLVRVSQHTNTKLADIAVAFVARVRERGPAQPEQCRAVTAVVSGLLAGTGRPAPGRCPTRTRQAFGQHHTR